MRYLLSQLRFRKTRALALGAAILVASSSFSLLLSTVRTSRLQVVGTVRKNFRPAYDILVRPADSFTALERKRGLVRANYLSGIYGGINFQQYQRVRGLQGVDVAAPIANVGYIMPFAFIPIPINRFVSAEGSRADVYRLNLDWEANGGLSRYPDADQYVYYTRRNRLRISRQYGSAVEVDDKGRTFPVCRMIPPEPPAERPFALKGQENLTCFSSRTEARMPSNTDFGFFKRGFVGAVGTAHFPVLVAAIDPAEERKLVDLHRSLVAGRMLEDDEGTSILHASRTSDYEVIPLLASRRSYVDEELVVTIERLDTPAHAELRNRLSRSHSSYRFLTQLTGQAMGTVRMRAAPIYKRLIDGMSTTGKKLEISYDGYWTSGSVDYTSHNGALSPVVVRNPATEFVSSYYGGGWAPQQERDTQFRKLTFHAASASFTGTVLNTPALRVVGTFDPERLPGFSPLSQVPLETYYPPTVLPLDPGVRRVVDRKSLLPNQNIGGYIAQPPLMLTTLKGLRALTDPVSFDDPNDEAPISVIRVRVAGVKGPDQLSRERIRRVAQAIHERTGLAVDITAGSSPTSLRVKLPEGEFGQPPMTVKEGWVQKGVAVAFLNAVDRKSLLLFVLVLVVCALFLANGAFASVSARRRELGVLSCLGWSRRDLFRAAVGELTAIGMLAGLAGTVLAQVLVSWLDLRLPAYQTLLILPVAILLTCAAGFVPAFRASRVQPLDAVYPAITKERKVHRATGLLAVALLNVRRAPARTALGAAGLLIGVGALTLVIAVNRMFEGQLAGTVMGRFISLDIRGNDVTSVVLMVALGGISVADVLFLNLRERAAEFVTLETLGWSDGQLRALVATEGMAVGVLGSFTGVAVAVLLMAAVPGLDVVEAVVSSLAAALIGCAVAAVAAVLPMLVIKGLRVSEALGRSDGRRGR